MLPDFSTKQILTAETGSEWAGNVFRHFPVFTSHIRTLSSNFQVKTDSDTFTHNQHSALLCSRDGGEKGKKNNLLIQRQWGWTEGWNYSRTHSCCGPSRFSDIFPNKSKKKKNTVIFANFCQALCRYSLMTQSPSSSHTRIVESLSSVLINAAGLTELTSQIFRVLSSDAETRRLESEDQATSEIPCRRTNSDKTEPLLNPNKCFTVHNINLKLWYKHGPWI